MIDHCLRVPAGCARVGSRHPGECPAAAFAGRRAGAVLIVEIDGPRLDVEHVFGQVEDLCRSAGAFEMRSARDAEERALFWKGRKSAFAAIGRISPDYIVQDGVVPRTALPDVLRGIEELSGRSGVRVANVFHAGDGNLHPLVQGGVTWHRCSLVPAPGRRRSVHALASALLA